MCLAKSFKVFSQGSSFLAALLLVCGSVGCAPSATAPQKETAKNTNPPSENIPTGKSIALPDAANSPEQKVDTPSAAAGTVRPASGAGEVHSPEMAAALIPRDVLFGTPDKAMARMSHDGKQLAFLAPVEGVLNVWVGPIDDPSAAKPVTHEKARPIEGYFWAYTNKHILYAQDDKGDENFHVYAVDLGTGETKDLTPSAAKTGEPADAQPNKVRAQIEGVSWKKPDEVVIGLNDRDPEFHDLYLININSGEKKLMLKNPEFAGFTVDEDFKVRFASKMAPDGGELTLQPDGKGNWTEYMKVGMEDNLTTSIDGFDKTGEVLYLIDSRGRDTGALKTVDLKTGAEKLIAENPLADVGGVMEHPTENTIQGVAFNYDRTHWQFFDKEVEADYNRLKKVADGEITIVSRTL
ncbi:MAG TPA: hypothetical protein VGJ15_07645, partial [Pirellulales bacterium]